MRAVTRQVSGRGIEIWRRYAAKKEIVEFSCRKMPILKNNGVLDNDVEDFHNDLEHGEVVHVIPD